MQRTQSEGRSKAVANRTEAKQTSAHGAKQAGGGEPKKGAETRQPGNNRSDTRNNIGPSGQGSHRGRERNNNQSMASGRSDIGSTGSRRN